MYDTDYLESALADLGEELDRLAGRGAPDYERAAAVARCELVLMQVAAPTHHRWLHEAFRTLAEGRAADRQPRGDDQDD